jgi:hypothetical protein
MINNRYKIDLSNHSAGGGYCTLYSISDEPQLAFKEFISKSRAEYARKIQKKLSKLDLAPKVISTLCKMKYDILFPNQKSGWGYISEVAFTIQKKNDISLKAIQKLVDEIFDKTKLKFWDCHWQNIGYVIRSGKKKLVCIDTGKETWNGYANYFGNSDPGPKCSYCLKYQCKCTGE